MTAPHAVTGRGLGHRWLTAADWTLVRGSSLRELAGRPGLGQVAWFDGGLGFLTLTAGTGASGPPAVQAAADLLTPTLARKHHGTYQVEEHATYRWTAYLAPTDGEAFVFAYTRRLDDGWELRIAEVGRPTAGLLLGDLATVVHRLAPEDRPPVEPDGGGETASLSLAQLDRLQTLRGRAADARDLLDVAGWPPELAASFAAAVDLPLVGVEARTAARHPDGGVALGAHRLWLSRTGWTWRVDADLEDALVTRLAPIGALRTLTRPLHWLDRGAPTP